MLLEALIGVALMAFVLAALPAGVVVSRQTVQKSFGVVGGRLVAEAVLNDEYAGGVLEAGTRSGVLDGYEWTALVRPRTSLQAAFKGKARWIPYDVIVSVTVPRGPRIVVETIRFGRS